MVSEVKRAEDRVYMRCVNELKAMSVREDNKKERKRKCVS